MTTLELLKSYANITENCWLEHKLNKLEQEYKNRSEAVTEK